MTKLRAKRILVAAFKALPKRDRDRLLWHAVAKTAICCGKKWSLFADGKGGG